MRTLLENKKACGECHMDVRGNDLTLSTTEIAKTSVHVPLNDMCTSESVHSVIFHYIAIELQKQLRPNSMLAVGAEAEPAVA